MTTSQSSVGNLVGDTFSYELGATSTAAQVATSSTNIFQILINATLNPTEDVFMRVYNVASAPTVGTTDPAMIIKCAKGSTQEVNIRSGVTFGTGVFVAVVTNKGSSGSSSPTGTVDWYMISS